MAAFIETFSDAFIGAEASKPPNFTNIQNKKTKNLPGSTGAQLYKNSTGNQWVVKSAKKGKGGFEQVKMELIANDIYEAVGIRVPKHKLDTDAKSLILEYIDGPTLKQINKAEMPGEESKGESKYKKAKAELQKGFIVDALIANWDVIGLDEDNIIIPSNGTPAVRIDNGGTFMFRASGGKKPFGKFVTEIDTMRNKIKAPQAYKIFGSLTDTDIDSQIKTIIVPNRQTILDITPLEIKPVMEARLDYLINKTVWTNATIAGENIKYKNIEKKVSIVPDAVELVETALNTFFNDPNMKANFQTIKMNTLKYQLKLNKAIISGGFILKAIGQFQDDASVDIDIYVPKNKAENFKSMMTDIFNPTDNYTHVQSGLQNSFFKKNGIYSVTKYSRKATKTMPYAEMDIVTVMDDRDPRDVIVNFDLSFCKNWYDGEKVYIVDKEGVYEKKGMLGDNYLKLLYGGNPVLINRMKKYINRGFKISINNPKTKQVEDITEGIKSGELYQQPSNVINNSSNNNSGNIGNITTTIEKRDISDKPFKIDIDPLSGNNININASVVKPINTRTLTKIDILAIKYYTGSGYTVINSFLYNRDYQPPISLAQPILEKLKSRFPENDNTKLMYYYFINLYNAVQKGPIANTIFKVYRGVKDWYLNTDTNKAYYMNSFTSTTTKWKTAKGFGSIQGNREYQPTRHIYEFYVHPLCRYMNVSSVSGVPREEEILLTPYHKYIYIDETHIDGGYTLRKYIVLPTDIYIHNTFEEFIEWKNSITLFSASAGKVALSIAALNGASNAVAIPKAIPSETKYINVSNIVLEEQKQQSATRGGRVPIYSNVVINNKTRNKTRNITKKTNKKLNNNFVYVTPIKNKSKMNTTRKVKNNTKSYNKDYIERMTAPIPSFPGKALTAVEKTIIEQMTKIIKNDRAIYRLS